MRLATVEYQGVAHAAIVSDNHVSLLPYAGIRELLEAGAVADAAGSVMSEVDLSDVTIGAPVPRPEKVICVGLNFRAHAAEAGFALPDHPTIFAKYWRALIGPYDEIEMPTVSDQVDWEAELGLIIGAPVRNATPDQAREAIAGYTVVNDISMRDWQMRTPQFLQGKTFERSTPVGPYLVTPDEVPNVLELAMTCSVNGVRMQNGSTSDMIFSPVELVAYISQIITLVPGDLIACGTPSGIGGLMKPPVYLHPGDVVTTSIDGLGELSNRCSEIGPVTKVD
jgi:acylpyruvate hydrolase